MLLKIVERRKGTQGLSTHICSQHYEELEASSYSLCLKNPEYQKFLKIQIKIGSLASKHMFLFDISVTAAVTVRELRFNYVRTWYSLALSEQMI